MELYKPYSSMESYTDVIFRVNQSEYRYGISLVKQGRKTYGRIGYERSVAILTNHSLVEKSSLITSDKPGVG
jgi:hypothetical protein